MKKSHKWRLCPSGSHYVRGHYKTTPSGKERFWNAHCRKNQGSRNLLTEAEIEEIAKIFSREKLTLPTPYTFGRTDGNKYDTLIAGWTKFWNETFPKQKPLDPDFVKTLMYTESSFRPEVFANTKNNNGQARGLLQITEHTKKLLKNKNELLDHHVEITTEGLNDPNINIAAGTRWIMRKQEIAKHFLKRWPTPVELAEEYKGIRGDKSKNAADQRKKFKDRWDEMNNARKKK